MNETLKTIEQRRSCRLFQNKSLSKEELEMILKAGIQAPSAMNKQLCEVFAITDPTLIDELAESIMLLYWLLFQDQNTILVVYKMEVVY